MTLRQMRNPSIANHTKASGQERAGDGPQDPALDRRLKSLLARSRIIPAVRSEADLELAARSSSAIVYLLCGSLSNLDHLAQVLHYAEKEIMVNLDLFSGLARDSHAVAFLAASGIAGIISTHVDVLSAARSHGLFSIQRTFIIDSVSVESSFRSLRRFVPDALELLPALAAPRILHQLRAVHQDIATIAGGLIASIKEADELVAAGIDAVSIGNPQMWQLPS